MIGQLMYWPVFFATRLETKADHSYQRYSHILGMSHPELAAFLCVLWLGIYHAADGC